DKMEQRVRRENIRVKDHQSRRAQSLDRHGMPFSWNEQPAHDETNACDVPERHSHQWRDQVLLERVLDKESAREEQQKPAQPREQLHPEKTFEIDRRFLAVLPWNLRTQQRRNGS